MIELTPTTLENLRHELEQDLILRIAVFEYQTGLKIGDELRTWRGSACNPGRITRITFGITL